MTGNDRAPEDRTKIFTGSPVLQPQVPVNILIVDDEPKNLTVLEAILDNSDYRLVRAATNAAKYGALSNDEGNVEIRWSANGEFTISWTERGGPDVVPPSRRGFGSTVMKAMAESSLDGRVDLEFPPAGLRWQVACPSSKVPEQDANISSPGESAPNVSVEQVM